MSDCLSKRLSMAVIGSYIIITQLIVLYNYIHTIQQGVGTHPCPVTISRVLHNTDQEVSAPTVSRHNIHQLSMVITSTLYPAPDTIVSLYTVSLNRIGCVTVLLDLRTTKSSPWSSSMSLFPVSTTSVTGSR